MPIRVKHFTTFTPNAGDTMISIKSRDLIREIIPDADIITLDVPITEQKINLFGKPDIIIVGGGPLFGPALLSDFPSSIDIPMYFLGVGTMFIESQTKTLRPKLEKFIGSLKNIRLASTRENATQYRLEQLGIKSRMTGCPVMHLSKESQWANRINSANDNDTLIFNYRDLYIPERLFLDESKAQIIANKLGFNKALIVAHSYEKNMYPEDPFRTPITKTQQQSLILFEFGRHAIRIAINKIHLKRYIHPVIFNSLKYSPTEIRIRRPGKKFYDAYAYPLLYHHAPILISYQLHSSIMAGAVGTPFLHIFAEESTRVRDMIDTYDPDFELHLQASSSNFEDVITKARSILNNPDPLANYNKRVSKAFEQWELFKVDMQNDLKALKFCNYKLS